MELLFTLAQQTVAPARSGAPLRVFAAILLVLIICGLIYVLRHLKTVEREIQADLPKERGPRDNIIFVVCAISFVAICLVLFLLIKA